MINLLVYISLLFIDAETNCTLIKLRNDTTVTHKELKDLRKYFGNDRTNRFDIKLAKIIGYRDINELYHDTLFRWKWSDIVNEYGILTIINE